MVDPDYENIVLHNSKSESNKLLHKKNDNDKIYDWNFAGFPITLGLIAILQYLYPVSNQSYLVGLFAPVDESVFEILKQTFWAIVFFSAIEYTQIKHIVNNYFIAKLCGMVVFGFTVFTAHLITGLLFSSSNVLTDAGPFIAGAALCQFFTYLVYRKPVFDVAFTRVSLAAIIVIAITFETSSIRLQVKEHPLITEENKTDSTNSN